ncbi:gliding motility-associated C-terminal domain-containing protein [Bacteroidia bacterium]|nr:gliding motility-associated C-terminal domain-containing protein [Bacteroidia bacterium]
MPRQKHILLLFLLLGAQQLVLGQSYFANGDARALAGSTCYELTSATNWQNGSVWYTDKLDLSKDFDLEFELNFGNKDAGGADGIVFVMQTVGNQALGLDGGGIGFEGFSPSIGIEFDVWQNANTTDIANDHIAIVKNGSLNHTGVNSISTPVPALIGGGNIEDGLNHQVRITWVASSNLLEVWFDCDKRQSTTVDIQNSIFGGQDKVFWGFTSATGGSNNRQVACLRDDILVQDTFTLCKGESILLNAKESFNGTYAWTPINFLDDPTSRTPECTSVVPQTYFVAYNDRCNNTFRDTVQVTIDEPFIMDEGKDTLLCDGRLYAFDLRNDYDSVLWNNGLRVARISWQTAGFYQLRAWKGVCYDDDSFTIRTDVIPTIDISGDTLFCEGEQTEVGLNIAPRSASFVWQDANKDTVRIFDETAALEITAENDCGNTKANYHVREIFLPPLDLGKDSTLCEGDTIVLAAPMQSNLVYKWSTGAVTNSVSVTDPGEYSVVISEADLCFYRDTVGLTGIPFPSIGLVEDVLLCRNEEIVLTVDNEFGEVLWDNAISSERFLLKNREGILSVKSVNQCGADSTNLFVNLIDCYCRLWLPNAITVNNDNLNETLRPTLDCPKLKSYNLKVYNRWGEQLWESSNKNEEWDAIYKGEPVQAGVYFWIVNWRGIVNGQLERFDDKGVLHVIR